MSAKEPKKNQEQPPEIKDLPEKPATTEQEEQLKGGRFRRGINADD